MSGLLFYTVSASDFLGVMKRRHKRDSRTFGELTFADQSRSILASALGLERAIRHHIQRAKTEGRDARHTGRWIAARLRRMIHSAR